MYRGQALLIALYWAIGLTSTIVLVSPSAGLGAVLYAMTFLYFVGMFLTEFVWIPPHQHQKTRFFLETMHTTVAISFIFGAFSEFTSFEQVFAYTAKCHIFMFPTNLFLLYYNIAHMYIPATTSSALDHALEYVSFDTQKTPEYRNTRIDIDHMRMVTCFVFVFFVLLVVIFFNQ